MNDNTHNPESATLPPTRSCNTIMKTAGRPGPNAARSNTHQEMLRTAPVSKTHSSEQTDPEPAPRKRLTMNIPKDTNRETRTRLPQTTNKAATRAGASAIGQTPVAPKNRNEPIGRTRAATPPRERTIPELNDTTTTPRPITRVARRTSRWSRITPAPAIRFETRRPKNTHRIPETAPSATVTRKRNTHDNCPTKSSKNPTDTDNTGNQP